MRWQLAKLTFLSCQCNAGISWWPALRNPSLSYLMRCSSYAQESRVHHHLVIILLLESGLPLASPVSWNVSWKFQVPPLRNGNADMFVHFSLDGAADAQICVNLRSLLFDVRSETELRPSHSPATGSWGLTKEWCSLSREQGADHLASAWAQGWRTVCVTCISSVIRPHWVAICNNCFDSNELTNKVSKVFLIVFFPYFGMVISDFSSLPCLLRKPTKSVS